MADLNEMMFGFIRSALLFHLAEAGALDGAADATTVRDAALCISQGNEAAAGRLLRAACAAGVLEAGDGGPEPSRALRDLVLSGEAGALKGFSSHLLKATFPAMAALPGRLAANTVARPADVAFPEMYRTPEGTAAFLDAMAGLCRAETEEIARSDAWGPCRVLVDIGGAPGVFARAALEADRCVRAVIFDLPQTAGYVARRARASGMAERLTFAPGDFFRDPVPQGDCHAVGFILSDWSDDDCVALLSKIHRAQPSGGTVLILERLVDPDGTGPFDALMMDLAMMAETQGRHRTADEYASLLARAGLGFGGVRRTAGRKHLIIGSKET